MNTIDLKAYITNKYPLKIRIKASIISALTIALLLVLLLAYTAIANDFLLKKASQTFGVHSADITDKPKQRIPVLKDSELLKTVQETITKNTNNEEVSLAKGELAKAPINSITQHSQYGLLPQISKSGLTPFDAYKKPIDLPEKNQPIIALALKNVGNSKKLTTQLLSTIQNKNITLLVSPYTQGLQNTIDTARKNGFETWLNIPLESQNFPYLDTGNKTILIRSSLTLNMQRLVWALTQASGYAGVYGHIDITFDHTEILMKSIFNYIFTRGLGFFETNNTDNNIPKLSSAIHKMPYQANDMNITPFNAQKTLAALANRAKINGTAIATIDLTPEAIQELPNWIKTIQKHGIQIVPISAIDDYIWAHKNK